MNNSHSSGPGHNNSSDVLTLTSKTKREQLAKWPPTLLAKRAARNLAKKSKLREGFPRGHYVYLRILQRAARVNPHEWPT